MLRIAQALLIGMLLLQVLGLPAQAEPAATEEAVSDLQIASQLGLIDRQTGSKEMAWERPVERLEAARLFLKLAGREQEALAFSGSNPFADVGQDAADSDRAVLSYLKAHPELGWTGVGGDRFEPHSPVTAKQLYKVVLELAGYRQGIDFDYRNVLSFGASVGLKQLTLLDKLKRDNLSAALVEMLKLTVKGSSTTLAEKLVSSEIVKRWLEYPRVEFKDHRFLGKYLVDDKGRALYTRKDDSYMASRCQDACAEDWPIFYAAKIQIPAELEPSDFGFITRKDGSKQSTFRGKPLYYFVRDLDPGDTEGEGKLGNAYTVKAPVTVKLQSDDNGRSYLADGFGRALYYYGRDPEGSSVCFERCLSERPLYYSDYTVVSDGLARDDFAVITRDDGLKQSTFQGFPLYYSNLDKRPGERNGEHNEWFLVDPVHFRGKSVSGGLAESPP